MPEKINEGVYLRACLFICNETHAAHGFNRFSGGCARLLVCRLHAPPPVPTHAVVERSRPPSARLHALVLVR